MIFNQILKDFERSDQISASCSEGFLYFSFSKAKKKSGKRKVLGPSK